MSKIKRIVISSLCIALGGSATTFIIYGSIAKQTYILLILAIAVLLATAILLYITNTEEQ